MQKLLESFILVVLIVFVVASLFIVVCYCCCCGCCSHGTGVFTIHIGTRQLAITVLSQWLNQIFNSFNALNWLLIWFFQRSSEQLIVRQFRRSRSWCQCHSEVCFLCIGLCKPVRILTNMKTAFCNLSVTPHYASADCNFEIHVSKICEDTRKFLTIGTFMPEILNHRRPTIGFS